ncbi:MULTISPECIES: hypothetical protein [Pseudomonas]|uniref:Uncharacterized protein n=1 Tax=Pseudomonas koreensis TaxID=198620 RepID=A0AA94JH84_9PSED|nr:hypothetical protein [Pseudomonas koreensis]RVD76185.1 hypothetical protein A9HBioS_3848 [Pseudomonas koreensis]
MAEEKLWKEGFERVTAGTHQVLKLDHFDIELRTTFGSQHVPLTCRKATPAEINAGLEGHVLEFSGNSMSEGVQAQMRVEFKREERLLRIKFTLFASFNAVVQIFNQDDRFVGEVNVSDGEFDYAIPNGAENSIGRLSMFYKLDYVGPTIDRFEGYSWKP